LSIYFSGRPEPLNFTNEDATLFLQSWNRYCAIINDQAMLQAAQNEVMKAALAKQGILLK
jgi:hypothetical protein